MSDLDDDELRATRILNGVENEIKVGEWVKLDNGNIGQVIAVEKGSIMLDIVQNRWVGMCCIKKHSKNIIDLIEVGDIVTYDSNNYGSDIIEVVVETCKVDEDYDKGEGFICTAYDDYIRSKYIKSIVTKEQFTKMEYKVKE